MNASDPQWTIDQLAQRTGMTVRNIRAHQSRGLLEPPTVRGRTGYYGPEQAARIELIQELQADGFNLEAIRRLLDAVPGGEAEPLRFLRAVHAPFGAEEPQPVTIPELVEDWGADSVSVFERSIALGLVRVTGEGTFEYPSPGMVRAAKQVVALGISLESQLDLVEAMQGPLASIAEAFVTLFLEQVWEPFQADGAPEERWKDMTAALEQLRPLTGEVLQRVFDAAMTQANESALSRGLEQL